MWSAVNRQMSTMYVHLESGRRDVNAATANRLLVHRVRGRQPTRAIQNRSQPTRRVGIHVQHDEDGSGKVGRQMADELDERRDAAARRADRDDISSMRHRDR